MKTNFIKDAVYNCHPQSGSDISYNRGVLVGLVSGIMAFDYDFTTSLTIIKSSAKKTLDLNIEDVYNSLPECWKETWNSIK